MLRPSLLVVSLAASLAALIACAADVETDATVETETAPRVQIASLSSSDLDAARRGGTNTETLADMPEPRPTPPTPVDIATYLSDPDAFAGIQDARQRSVALWGEVIKVVGHPRCMNCHNVDGPITQGDDMQPHQPLIARGDDTFGNAGMKCSTCHAADNVDYLGAAGSIPGHDPWHVAPRSMGWQGLSSGEICAAIKDTSKNGDRTLEEIWEHHAKDGLVGWAWEPGTGRTPAPGTQEQFGRLTRAWIDSGAVCPS